MIRSNKCSFAESIMGSILYSALGWISANPTTMAGAPANKIARETCRKNNRVSAETARVRISLELTVKHGLRKHQSMYLK